MAEEQKENQAQNGTQETRLPLSIDRSKEISKYMNVFNASFAYNEVFLEMGLGRVLDEAGKQSSVANVAVARELACWCWAVGRMAEGA